MRVAFELDVVEDVKIIIFGLDLGAFTLCKMRLTCKRWRDRVDKWMDHGCVDQRVAEWLCTQISGFSGDYVNRQMILRTCTNLTIKYQIRVFYVCAVRSFCDGLEALLNTPGDHQEAKNYALCAAAHHGNVAIISLLFEHHADLNFADTNGLTPLIFAVISENLESVKFLVENGADPQAKDKHGRTALNFIQIVETNTVFYGSERPSRFQAIEEYLSNLKRVRRE